MPNLSKYLEDMLNITNYYQTGPLKGGPRGYRISRPGLFSGAPVLSYATGIGFGCHEL